MIVSIDFDGVLHEYTSPWTKASEIHDGPVPGAIDWLMDLARNPDIQPTIFSSRSHQVGGVEAMQEWLIKYGFEEAQLVRVSFSLVKPPAKVTIDDRALTFEGTFPTIDELKAFKPWNKRV